MTAAIVLDHFHVKKYLNDALDTVRREELNKARKENNDELSQIRHCNQRFILMQTKESKRKQDILEYYRKGLAIEPLWPQGQFNAAMLAGELHSYKWAALYMKHYLELVPDAKNANAAREKMYLWEEKAKEKQQKLTGAGE